MDSHGELRGQGRGLAMTRIFFVFLVSIQQSAFNLNISTEGAARALTFENFCQDIGLPARTRTFVHSFVLPEAHPRHAFSNSPSIVTL
jgi:hypothetical protein